MSQQPDEGVRRRETLVAGLEAARLEVVRRLEQRQLPCSVSASELHIVDNDNGGWSTDWVNVQQSSLRNFQVQGWIGDDSVPFRLLGLRPQLEPLADLLNRTTDLGTRPANFMPEPTGVEGILVRYLTSLATEYLCNVPDLSHADSDLIDRLARNLEELVAPGVILNTSQLAIAGIKVSAPLEDRGVRLRPLSPRERGQYWESRNHDLLTPAWSASRFFVPRRILTMMPSTLLEVTTSRPRTEPVNQSTLLNRVALAFFLLGFTIASPGIAVSFDHPTWATYGQSHQRSLVDEKLIAETHPLSEADFHGVVDLAYHMPEFGPGETNSQEIALYRALRGLGMHWQESGFLDFVIALEAVLLRGFNDELSYRFALYGSLFLAETGVDPQQTFARLKNIYDVRSKLVHGSKVSSTKRQQAFDDAPELVKAIFLKTIQQGWPDSNALDELALKGKSGPMP